MENDETTRSDAVMGKIAENSFQFWPYHSQRTISHQVFKWIANDTEERYDFAQSVAIAEFPCIEMMYSRQPLIIGRKC